MPMRSLKVGHDFAYGLGHVAQLVRTIDAQLVYIGGGAHRVVDHRSFPGQELEIETHAFQRQEKVGEDDGGIDIKLLRGGDRHLGGELRVLANLSSE